jgi:3-methylcrotonyl-CoA carboxylase alpha subunit
VIESLLVANRGEIACRIFRTARRLGIRTIAVFSEADAGARHVREADAAVCIGAAAPRDSYLNITRIIEAARQEGARAIHPGYGFLAENAALARACHAAGIEFVGPPAEAIEAMGSKSLARSRMRAASVPVLPGYDGPGQELSELHGEALKLGFPLIIKPSAGGGGKGMRIVSGEGELAEALAGARRLAQSAFGDGTLVLERFLLAPRHVEVQVFADAAGRIVHLGDRDCSIQRRHQKLIEEAPAPAIPAQVREKMGAAALTVAREIGYVSAGTVEFLLNGTDFYFMEMNTRLQVEHTVTEAVTGLDLVEWQLRIVSGEPLPQAPVELRGSAIEARVCAEDPEHDFLPSAGRLHLMVWPQGEGVRVDAGFDSGDRVPETYDSLLGKVIAWAPSREVAAARLAHALDRTYSAGVHTNERWLARILRNERFLAAQHSVAFLQDPALALGGPTEPGPRSLAIAALRLHWKQDTDRASPWAMRDGFTPNLPARVGRVLSWHGRPYRVELEFHRRVPQRVRFGTDGGIELADILVEADAVSVRMDGALVRARTLRDDDRVHIWLETDHFEFLLDDPVRRDYVPTAERGGLATPLPGVVTTVRASVGQRVAAGEVLMVIEAMKMEHAITAPHSGTVQAIHFGVGDRVKAEEPLLELENADEASKKRPTG